MRLFLVTHGETLWTAQGRFQGHADIVLNERGLRQANALQRHLAGNTFQAIVASDLARARKMAEILALPHGLTVQIDPRLRELDFGAWEGLLYEEVQQRYPSDLAAWQANPPQVGPPGGERLTELARRLQDFLTDLANHPEDSTILVAAHRGSLRTLLCLLMGLAVTQHWEFRLEIASLSEVEIIAGKATVVRLNETMVVG